MTYTPIPKGTQNWDVPLNAALSQLDANITSGSTSALQAANNLSDLTNVIQARSNLGISAGVVQGVNSFNVKDYGALGNGTTDDTVAIQNAINAAGTNGGQVFFPAGQYKINTSSPLNNTHDAVTLMGSGISNTKIVIGSGFTGSAAITNTGNYFVFQNMSLEAANSTTTSNPACHGIVSTGGHTFRVLNASFLNINGYAVKAIGTATTQLHGGSVSHTKIQNTAGGVFIQSDPTQTAANFILDNVFTRFVGVNSGTNANLDCFHIEDSWDVLMQNCFAWMNATTGGTGASLRVKGNCAAIFIQNLDALGPQTGNNVVLEDGPNGSPQNVQITGGVIQQGNVGLVISGGTTQVRVSTVRIINNQTHGVSVTGTGTAINIDRCFFSLNGQAATGTNYDVNWSGTSTGWLTFCRFASPIVSTGTAGVQFSVNVTAGQAVKIINADFAGTGAAQANWVTAFPSVFSHAEAGNYEFFGNVNFSFSGAGRVQLAPSTTTNSVLSTNTNGTDAFDRFRLTGDGKIAIGPGTSTRDTSVERITTAQFGSNDSDIVANLAGKTFKVKSGTNAKAGTVTANGTTAVTVSTTAITANSVVVFGLKTQAGTAATTAPFMSAVTPGTSFQIKSSAGDTSVYNWVILDLI